MLTRADSYGLRDRVVIATAANSLLVAFFIIAHFVSARHFRGNRSGNTLSWRIVITCNATAMILTMTVITQIILHVLGIVLASRVDKNPNAPPSTDLLLILIAVWVLQFSGHFAVDRRRREVAVKLASIPVFGDGFHTPSHPTFIEGNAAFSLTFPIPRRILKRHSMPVSPSRMSCLESRSDLSAASSTTETDVERSRAGTHQGLVRRLIWEIPCRSANTWLNRPAQSRMWPMHVVRTVRLRLKRLLLIHDPVIQDRFGAHLLSPSFTHSYNIDSSVISATVYRAVDRAALCVLGTWLHKFDYRVLQRYASIPAVASLLKAGSELSRGEPTTTSTSHCNDLASSQETGRLNGTFDKFERHGECYFTDIAWAVITVEILDYLQRKRKDTPFLDWMVALPQWLASQRGNPCIHDGLNSIAERWTSGQLCGSFSIFSGFQSCNSSCCCHDSRASVHGNCGCQCACVCTCVWCCTLTTWSTRRPFI